MSKLETFVIATKGFCHAVLGVGVPLGVSLAQYANTGDWPSKIVWWGVVVPACAVGLANSLLAWTGSSFKTYMDDKKEEESKADPPPKPTA